MKLMRWFGITPAIAIACAFVAPAFAQDATYIGEAACKVCHNKKDEGEQWNKWKGEAHAKAIETLRSPEAIEIGKAKGLAKPPAESPECLKCHVTALDPATGKTPPKIQMASSVQCESCHGPGSNHQKEGMKALKKDATADTKGTVKKADVETCKQCHNDQSPTWKPDRYTTKDGQKVGFDFEQAWAKIAHPNPKKAQQ